MWQIIAVITIGATAAVGAGGWWALTRVLPGPWHAHHAAQVASDRAAPGTVEVTSATWDFERGGFIIDGRLREDPEATVTWLMATSTDCAPDDPDCSRTISSAVDTTRIRVEETRTLVTAFNAAGCQVTGVSDLRRYDGEVSAKVVVVLPRDQVPVAAQRLDRCLQAWARARPPSGGAASVGALLSLVEPGTGHVHSVTRGDSDATGHLTTSTAGSLAPATDPLEFERQNDIDGSVDHAICQWLATQGNPQIAATHVNPAYTRYAPGRTDRVVMYAPGIPRSTPEGVFLGEGAVAVTVNPDGSNPDNFRVVPFDDHGPADPELPR
jgi:hypothetical protein